jgi:hypothetical protein
MSIEPNRPEINATPPASHGALDYAELEQLGLHPDEVTDFSVNSNPFGPFYNAMMLYWSSALPLVNTAEPRR